MSQEARLLDGSNNLLLGTYLGNSVDGIATPPLGKTASGEIGQKVIPLLSPVGTAAGFTEDHSTALQAGRIMHIGACTLVEISAYNDKGTDQFVQVHNAVNEPADTSVPLRFFKVPTKDSRSWVFQLPAGLPLSVGLYVCNSSTGPTKTIGSADCSFAAVLI